MVLHLPSSNFKPLTQAHTCLLKSNYLVGSLLNKACGSQFTASMWTPEEASQAVSIAREIVPDIKVMSLPKGLQVEKGPEGVIEYGMAHLPGILGS